MEIIGTKNTFATKHFETKFLKYIFRGAEIKQSSMHGCIKCKCFAVIKMRRRSRVSKVRFFKAGKNYNLSTISVLYISLTSKKLY